MAGAIAAVVYFLGWWLWLPDIAEEATVRGHGFVLVLVALVIGLLASYALVAAIVYVAVRLARPRRRRPDQRIEPH